MKFVARIGNEKFEFPVEKYNALESERKAVQSETEQLQAQKKRCSQTDWRS